MTEFREFYEGNQVRSHVAAFNYHCQARQVKDHVDMWEDYIDAKENAAAQGIDFVWDTDHMSLDSFDHDYSQPGWCDEVSTHA